MQTIYLDIMENGRFFSQLPYEYCPLWPIDLNDITAKVLSRFPSLKKRKFNIEFSHSKTTVK